MLYRSRLRNGLTAGAVLLTIQLGMADPRQDAGNGMQISTALQATERPSTGTKQLLDGLVQAFYGGTPGGGNKNSVISPYATQDTICLTQ